MSDQNSARDAYHNLAKALHPDVGGSNDSMRDLNILNDAAKARPFQFTNAVPQSEVQVDARPAPPTGSDDERIANARAIGLQRDMTFNTESVFGGQHNPRFFINTRGFGSGWTARHILFIAQLINTPASLIDGKYLRDSNLFDPTTGIFESDSQPLSIVELTVAYKLQIRSLGISEVLLEEFLAGADYDNMQAFYALDFDSRMEKFR